MGWPTVGTWVCAEMSFPTVDHTCEIAGKDQTAYGWKCVVQLGLQRRDIAIGNAGELASLYTPPRLG